MGTHPDVQTRCTRSSVSQASDGRSSAELLSGQSLMKGTLPSALKRKVHTPKDKRKWDFFFRYKFNVAFITLLKVP